MGGIQWWCSAQNEMWSWTWQPYPGVWSLVGAGAALYVVAWRSGAPPSDGRDSRTGRYRAVAGTAGLVILWVALDWPLGALGAGYLASAHMVQYLLVALVAPALLLLGTPASAFRALHAGRRRRAVLRFLTHPLITLAIFSLVLYYTHLPAVVDNLMRFQAGSFLIDMLWLSAGVLFWWPVIAPVPERPRFSYPVQMGYLFAATVVNTMPYAFLTFGDLPFYGIYELAPRVAGIDARQDQQIAGLLMKVGGGLVLWTAITILFFRWYGKESESPVVSAPGP